MNADRLVELGKGLRLFDEDGNEILMDGNAPVRITIEHDTLIRVECTLMYSPSEISITRLTENAAPAAANATTTLINPTQSMPAIYRKVTTQ